MRLNSRPLVLIFAAVALVTLVIYHQSSPLSLRRIKLIQYYEKEVEFKDL
jgi:hypothetical protein